MRFRLRKPEYPEEELQYLARPSLQELDCNKMTILLVLCKLNESKCPYMAELVERLQRSVRQ